MKGIFKLGFLLLLMAVLIFATGVYCRRNHDSYPERGCIAHGGGAIDGCTYTNSREALENAIAKGLKFIEIDLGMTSDSVLVAIHDWGTYRAKCGLAETDEPLAFDEFMSQKIHGRYSPLSAALIDSILAEHPQVVLVTDKIDDADVITRSFPSLKGRLMTECFSDEAYDKAKRAGIYPMRNYYAESPDIWGVGRPYVLDKVTYDEIKDTKTYKIITRLFNCRMNLYILKRRAHKGEADSLMAKDPYIEHIYIDEF